MDGLQQREIQT